MKTTLITLSFLSILSTAAAFAGETFVVTEDRARALQAALVAAGAAPRVVVDESTTAVQDVECSRGYDIGTHSSFVNCSFNLAHHIGAPGGTGATYFSHVAVRGAQAQALIDALEDAGVKGARGREDIRYAANAIDCTSLVMAPLRQSCEITLDTRSE